MDTRNRKLYITAAAFLLIFVAWTVVVSLVDVRAIGPQNSMIGLASLNIAFHRLTGVHMWLYSVTDWLGLVPFVFVVGFAILGLVQWIRRKKLRYVDFSIMILGGFYIITMAVYVLFEYLVINYRPVLINSVLEASYPSSTTMLVMCVMPTSMMQLYERIKRNVFKWGVMLAIVAFIGFMVTGRLLSGVHWVSDIIGGGLLSAGLVTLYAAVCKSK